MSSTRRMTQPDWATHSDTINNLYFEKGLPLKSKGAKPSLMEIMKREYQFDATPAQYESYLKGLKKSKNLKRVEWRAVFKTLDDLTSKGMRIRVKLSGQVLSEETINRRRRYAEKDFHGTVPSTLPASVTIEVHVNGLWLSHNARPNMISSLPLMGALGATNDEASILEVSQGNVVQHDFIEDDIGGEFMNFDPADPSTICSPWEGLHYSSYSNGFARSPNLLQFDGSWPLSLSMPSFSRLSSPVRAFSPTLTLFQPLESPHDQLLALFPIAPTQVCRSSDNGLHSLQISSEWKFAMNRTISQTISKYIFQKLFQTTPLSGATSAIVRQTETLSDPGTILSDLNSLVSDTLLPEISNSIASFNNFNFDLVLEKALIYSITNGFTGLEKVPAASMLKLLKKIPQIFDFLSSSSLQLVRSLADNLFRLAVEACDEQAVEIILKATQDSPNVISPDEIICYHKGRRYTPIELAALCRQPQMVELLLTATADINKTYEPASHFECGPLELVVKIENCKDDESMMEPVVFTIVQRLLKYRVGVRVNFLDRVLEAGKIDLALILIYHVLPMSHHQLFEHQYLMIEMTRILPNQFASKIIQLCFSCCESEKCKTGLGTYSSLNECIIWCAAMRANHDLVFFMLRYAKGPDWQNTALLAALKNGTPEGRALVDMLLKEGATVDGLARSPKKSNGFLHRPQSSLPQEASPMTHLAEAIRSKHSDLVELFEKQGALLHLEQKYHLEAAMAAAAEVGDCGYMQKILKHAPKAKGGWLHLALVAAIQNDETEAALFLLSAGASVNPNTRNPVAGTPLQLVVEKKNTVVLDKILECDIVIRTDLPYDTWRQAIEWKDFPVLEGLVPIFIGYSQLGYRGALIAAVMCKNRSVVNIFLDHGADVNECIKNLGTRDNLGRRDEMSPLCAAIVNEDVEMAELLLLNGAEPADETAFGEALRNKREIFSFLLRQFSERYPKGKIGFGACLLNLAVEKNDKLRFDLMLNAKFDVNKCVNFGICQSIVGRLGSALQSAILRDNKESVNIVRQLLEAGADLNRISVACSESPLLIAIRNKSEDIVKILLENGADSNKTSGEPLESPLMTAIKTKSENLVRLLLEKGADAKRPARRGLKRTPLQQACEVGCFNIVLVLLNEGVDVNEPPAERGGATALQFAAISGNTRIFKYLFTRGADIHGPTSIVNGRTVLEGAAEHGRLEMIREIWNAASGEGFGQAQIDSAIHLAKENGYRHCADYVSSLSSLANFTIADGDLWMGFCG